MKVLTPTEAAEFLGIGRTKLYDAMRKGQLNGTYYRVGRRLLFIQRKLEEWAEAGGTEGCA